MERRGTRERGRRRWKRDERNRLKTKRGKRSRRVKPTDKSDRGSGVESV